MRLGSEEKSVDNDDKGNEIEVGEEEKVPQSPSTMAHIKCDYFRWPIIANTL